MPTLHIQLLGGFAVRLDGHTISGLDHQRLQTLLAYLILHCALPTPRRRVAAVLWPESSEAQALANLRNLVYRLRSALPSAENYIFAENQQICWRPKSHSEVDVANFEANLARAASFTDVTAQGSALDAAIQCYSGTLLPDCYDDWAIEAREHLQQRFHAALLRLIHLLEARQEYTDAIRHTHRLLRDEPLQEAHYRLLMRLYALSGDRAGIIQTFQMCAAVLQGELDIEPADETSLLYQQLGRSPALPAPASPTAGAGSALIGQETAWRELQLEWQRATRDGARLVVIVGELGIGKTHLAQAFLTWAKQQGVSCAEARCYAAEGEVPYSVPAAWLRSASVRADLAALDPVSRLEVARLSRDLVAAEAGPGEPPPTDLLQRQRLFDALAQALIGDQRPRVLLVDDVDTCDRETVEWLHFLVRSAAAAPLLLIGTARPEKLGADHQLHRAMASLRRLDRLATVELRRLDRRATAALAASLCGRELSQSAGERLYQATEGVPLFVVELLRAGLLDEPARPGGRNGNESQPVALPAALADALAGQLAQLSPTARELASIVALAGHDLPFETLSAVAEMGETSLLEGLDELLQRVILVETHEGRFALSHQALRGALLAQLSSPRRHTLERRMAAVGAPLQRAVG